MNKTPIEQAFEAWHSTHYLANNLARDYSLAAFEAGWNALSHKMLIEHPMSDSTPERTYGVPPAGGTITADTIYAAYPRKVGRGAAIKAIQKAGKAVGMEKLLKAVKAYAEATSRWPVEERQYIPHPATWVNRGSYDDDPKEWERGTAPASQFSVTH